jgi:hypothetical protein
MVSVSESLRWECGSRPLFMGRNTVTFVTRYRKAYSRKRFLVSRSCYDYRVFSRNSRNNSIPAEPFFAFRLGKPRARAPDLYRSAGCFGTPVDIFGHGARHGFNSRPTGNFFRHRPRAGRGRGALRRSGRPDGEHEFTWNKPAMGKRLSAGRYRAPRVNTL